MKRAIHKIKKHFFMIVTFKQVEHLLRHFKSHLYV